MIRNAVLHNPRNCYQNYNCAVNLSDRTIYTYMGVLRPRAANATFSSAGELSPLLNDPYYWTLGTGTRIFLGGAAGAGLLDQRVVQIDEQLLDAFPERCRRPGRQHRRCQADGRVRCSQGDCLPG